MKEHGSKMTVFSVHKIRLFNWYMIWAGAFLVKLSGLQTHSISSNVGTKSICSGLGSTWNISTLTCVCAKDMWGEFCQYGRRRFHGPHGVIFASKGDYHSESKYIYLVDTGRSNKTIRFTMNEFVTECNWDTLYIFDGKSIYDPLLAAYSGVIRWKENPRSLQDDISRLQAKSGAALIYFYSDKNINDGGYNLSYQVSTCDEEICSNHGLCTNTNECKCDEGWKGPDCSQKSTACCVSSYDLVTGVRSCKKCTLTPFSISSRASHASAMVNSDLYVYGGFSYNKVQPDELYKFDFRTKSMFKASPLRSRYSHTMVSHGDQLIVYGGNILGRITNEIMKYKILTNSWFEVKTSGATPISVMGHASVVVYGVMYVFFGFNHEALTINSVQTLDLATDKWTILNTTGAIIAGRYGHSASYDLITNTVYIFGGFTVKHSIVSTLLMFQIDDRRWVIAQSSMEPRMLHSSVILGRNLIIFGGNAHNATDKTNTRNQCHSKDVLIYNIYCKRWLRMSYLNLFNSEGRYGHSSVVYNDSFYVIGGYNGVFLGDLLEITIQGDCSLYNKKRSKCLDAPALLGCVWSDEGKCLQFDPQLVESTFERPACNTPDICSSLNNCMECMGANCVWSASTCQSHKNIKHSDLSQLSQCNREYYQCAVHSSCTACNRQPGCAWNFGSLSCGTLHQGRRKSDCFMSIENATSCNDIHDCAICTQKCIWCESEQQCVNSLSYPVNFPYGQCMEWISFTSKTSCKEMSCEGRETCQHCFELPGCGWCSDESNTGTGVCKRGTDDGPRGQPSTCPTSQWHFMECPACQCNGHSKCYNGTDRCIDCFNNVQGKHCDRCKFGYYGNPARNGTCQPCTCNGHLRDCKPDGACVCDLRGATGVHCEKCDEQYHYVNDSHGSLCLWELAVDFLYTTNVTSKTMAAFTATPNTVEKDLRLKITRINGGVAKMNFSIHFQDGRSTSIISNYLLGHYSTVVNKEVLKKNRATVRVVIFGWERSEHFEFKISFTHSPHMFDLVNFLIMFMVCFCSFVILLLILWKVKQRYNVYRRNRRQLHEHEKRINRPFKTVCILTDERKKPSKTPLLSSHVAFEPFANSQHGIVSVLIELPRGGGKHTPPEQCGMCVGSTVVVTPHRWILSLMQYNHGKKRHEKHSNTGAVAV